MRLEPLSVESDAVGAWTIYAWNYHGVVFVAEAIHELEFQDRQQHVGIGVGSYHGFRF